MGSIRIETSRDWKTREKTESTREQFISEALVPIGASFATASMVAGEPGLPLHFCWRNTEYEVAEVLDKWKMTGA